MAAGRYHSLAVVARGSTTTEPGGTAQTFALSAAYPNPFSTQTTLTLAVPDAQHVDVVLFDVLGRRVAVLHEGLLPAGEHALSVDASGLPSGVYVVGAQGEGFSAGRRVTVAR